jgi:hypothetical protein
MKNGESSRIVSVVFSPFFCRIGSPLMLAHLPGSSPLSLPMARDGHNWQPREPCQVFVEKGKSDGQDRKPDGQEHRHELAAHLPCVQTGIGETIMPRGMPPQGCEHEPAKDHGQGIKDGSRPVARFTDHRCGKGDEGNDHQEQEVERQQPTVVPPDQPESAVMPQPEGANGQKTDQVGQVLGPEPQRLSEQLGVARRFSSCRQPDVQRNESDGDGEHGVAEEDQTLQSKLVLVRSVFFPSAQRG